MPSINIAGRVVVAAALIAAAGSVAFSVTRPAATPADSATRAATVDECPSSDGSPECGSCHEALTMAAAAALVGNTTAAAHTFECSSTAIECGSMGVLMALELNKQAFRVRRNESVCTTVCTWQLPAWRGSYFCKMHAAILILCQILNHLAMVAFDPRRATVAWEIIDAIALFLSLLGPWLPVLEAIAIHINVTNIPFYVTAKIANSIALFSVMFVGSQLWRLCHRRHLVRTTWFWVVLDLFMHRSLPSLLMVLAVLGTGCLTNSLNRVLFRRLGAGNAQALADQQAQHAMQAAVAAAAYVAADPELVLIPWHGWVPNVQNGIENLRAITPPQQRRCGRQFEPRDWHSVHRTL